MKLLTPNEIPNQKYQVDDLTQFSLNQLKRKYELGMVFTAMLSKETDPRASKAMKILIIQMANIFNEWKVRMAQREIKGLPVLEIWQHIPKDDLIKIANKHPETIWKHTRVAKPIPSDQVVKLNTLDLLAHRGQLR